MSHRFFVADESTYENVRRQLDAAWGHPLPDGTTVTCIDPAFVAPRTSRGDVLLAVNSEFCEYEAVARILPQLLSGGAVTEISEATYLASVVTPLSQ